MSYIQSIRFNKKYYDEKEAEQWLKLHKFEPIKHVDITKNWLRYRITDPYQYKRFITKRLPYNMEIVIGFN